MEFFIRPAGPIDAEAIALAQQISWQATYANLLRPESLERVRHAWDAAHWRRSLERTDDRTVTLVIENERTGIVGFGVAGARRGRGDPILDAYAGEVYLLYLVPAFQKRGHGARLMAAMARVLRARGLNSAVVWALARNRAAIGFYQHLGGSILTQCRKPFFGESVAEIAVGWTDITILAEPSRNPRG